MTRLLHVTLGPVQGFVAQARRTQDLWAGSFLLSWLSGQAMRAVTDADGTIVFPKVASDPLFEAIANRQNGVGPAVGSLPNRFKAQVPDDFDPAACRAAVQASWRRLADLVWKQFVHPLAGQGHGTKGIWDRQIRGFWETAWVVGDQSDHAWLDRRKNWRSHRPPVEGGDHCMLMGDWQELSGFVRSRERAQQDAFWQALKKRVDDASTNPLNLDANERLCALALIKRLFPDVATEVLGWRPSWNREPVSWPSTPRLAAAGWLKHAWAEAPDEARAFVAIAKKTRGGLMEPEVAAGNVLSQVPGALLHRSGIENARADELGDDPEDKRKELLRTYGTLADKVGEPSTFYALLLMDGDKVGALLRDRDEDAVSTGLGTFAGGVDATVRKHGGNTVYAGGDDVLALLPLEGALPAALDLREAYRNAFGVSSDATISAALVFAHFHVPLRHVLDKARRQLKDVAKEENGRDSLAVCVLTQGGITRQWVSTWDDRDVSPPRELMQSARDLEERTSSRFFYAVDARYRDLLTTDGGHDRSCKEGAAHRQPLLGIDDMRAMLLAEYLRSGAAERLSHEDAWQHIDRLLVLAGRHAKEDSRRAQTAPLVAMDGPLIARFLAREARRTAMPEAAP